MDREDRDMTMPIFLGITALLYVCVMAVVFSLMACGVGMVHIPPQDRGVVIEKGIFEGRFTRFSGQGPDNYWIRLQNVDDEGWVEFWVKLGNTQYAVDMWNSTAIGDTCTEGGGRKGNITRWSCQ